jgi:hypothetical protein
VSPALARNARVAVVAVVLLLGILPVAEWIPGGHTLAEYPVIIEGWWLGVVIALGAGWVLALGARAEGVARALHSLERHWSIVATRPATPWGVAAVAFGAYVAVAALIFDRLPINIDEIVQVWQARMYAAGDLKLPSLGAPEFFGMPHIIDDGIWRYGQFPFGAGLMLVPGAWLGAEWLTGPVFGGIGVLAFGRFLPYVESRPGVRLAALLLFAFAPFALFMSGSHMNHVPTLAWSALGLWAAAAALADGQRFPFWAAGSAFGLAGIIRPVDALAVTLPLGIWILSRVARRQLPWDRLALFVVAGLIPVAVLAWVNAQTTGSPLLFGYERLWGPAHNLGFHAAPWGDPHTPIAGLELIGAHLFRLNTFFLETPFPALLLPLGWWAFSGRLSGWDRYLAASGLLLLVLYFSYWFGDFYLGPRFLYQLLPSLALATARVWPLIAERVTRPALQGTLQGALVAGLAIALVEGIPRRAANHAGLLEPVRWSADALAAEAGAVDGIVLVRESWGAQLIARLWGRGLSRADAEQVYHGFDACDLERALDSLEAHELAGDEVARGLRSRADRSGLIRSPFSPDRSEQFRPGTRYTRECVQRIDEDRRGFTLMPPTLLATGPLLWARDQHAGSRALLSAAPGRPVWVLIPADSLAGSRPQLRVAPRDSLLTAWGGAGGE